MKLFLLIDVTLPQKSRISGFDPCIATVCDPVQPFPVCFCKALSTLVFASGDQKLRLWYHLSVEGIGLATIHCQKTIWHWGLLNITTHWNYWFYVFFFIWNYFSATGPFGAQAVVLFFNLPIEEQCFKHLTIFFSPLLGESQALTLSPPKMFWNLPTPLFTSGWIAVSPARLPAETLLLEGFTTVNTVRAEIYTII